MEVRVGGFVEAARGRVSQARAALGAAREAGDVYAVAVAEDELEDALRIAEAHGVDTEGEL
ncbi:hypothetical protein [Streptomyces hiroshimensis]|uniref:Uncharacterized protein n=1 Tax=Streptomyces hiroshimensis TaxID=66424 RepID=A0ABQ2ZB14_9ACTN|nr:hypothetical protein [Streptomyces hiroshimensis]GGY07530.1 hypothetical protein GCM10010324_62910 [Streptomyces hiroshimensis]